MSVFISIHMFCTVGSGKTFPLGWYMLNELQKIKCLGPIGQMLSITPSTLHVLMDDYLTMAHLEQLPKLTSSLTKSPNRSRAMTQRRWSDMFSNHFLFWIWSWMKVRNNNWRKTFYKSYKIHPSTISSAHVKKLGSDQFHYTMFWAVCSKTLLRH